jgi:hypothetical protein
MITTNGYVRMDGKAVMGRGVALQATQRYSTIQADLGKFIRESRGLHVRLFIYSVMGKDEVVGVFPVKYNFREKADKELIINSSLELARIAADNTWDIFLLPRPGCGNGQLKWTEVKPLIEHILPDNVWVITNEVDR